MSRDDRDWYREAIRERDSKNKVVQFDKKRKINKTSKKLKSSQTKKYEGLVVAGIFCYAIFAYVLKNFFVYPGCAAVIAMNILVFALIKFNKLDIQALGNSYYSSIVCKEYYRIITSAFTHYDPLHLLFNLASLYNIGPYMESVLGTAGFIFFYSLVVLLGGYISARLRKKKPYIPSIGASGAICGIFGIYLALAFILMGFAGITSMLPTIIILLLMTFSPKIDSIGHFTGLVIGIIYGIVLVYFL